MTNNNNNNNHAMITKDLVLSYLRPRKIKLWLSPYHNGNRESSSQQPNLELNRLAHEICSDLELTGDEGDDIPPILKKATQSQATTTVCSILLDLQSHAVQKLIEKHTIDLKIVATDEYTSKALVAAVEQSSSSLFAGWGDKVVVVKGQDDEGQQQKQDNSNNGTAGSSVDNEHKTITLVIRIVNISPVCTIDQLSADIRRILKAKTLRFLWRGRNLFVSTNFTSFSNAPGDGNLRTMLRNSKTKNNEMVCIASGSFTAELLPSSPTMNTTSIAQDDPSIIRSIREAARTIQGSKMGSRFEITDQSGRLVAMSDNDMVSFLTALGLHRLGRSKMETNSRENTASALMFLLEADVEWNQNPSLETWKQKVDNYGLLQLDIAWCYLLLESLDALPDALRRLETAETVLRKQVHKNFVPLAIAQAETRNPIPPLIAVFVRLFLLQGVAHKIAQHQQGGIDAGNKDTGKEQLEWARLLCNRLRSDCPTESVNHLCHALLVDKHTVITALRRSNGDTAAASDLIALDQQKERLVARKRYQQKYIGKCSNGMDYVDLEKVPILCGYLGFSAPSSSNNEYGGSGFDGDADGRGDHEPPATSTLIVTGLLRLSNNDIEKSLELYRELSTEQIFHRIEELDKRMGKRKRLFEREWLREHRVSDVDLTMLVSMGIDEVRGRRALRMTGNVDDALLWLSRSDAASSQNDEIARSDSTESSSPQSSPEGGNNNSSSHSPLVRKTKAQQAQELLMTELGKAIQDGSNDLEKEWLGADMQEEWNMIEKYA